VLPEYYLVVATGLLLNAVTWDFYVIALIPVFLAVFLAPRRFLPGGPWLWVGLGAAVAAYVTLNYPGDFYFFYPNDFFFHPEWVPGTWVEDKVGLYHEHLDAILLLRLPALLFTAGCLAALVLWRRLGPGVRG
jgi:hypothetical protein